MRSIQPNRSYARRFSRRMRVESLEARQMMTVDISAVVSGGTLTVTGSSSIDEFTFDTITPGKVTLVANAAFSTINGAASAAFNVAQIQNIVVNLNEALDLVSLNSFNFNGDLTINLGSGDNFFNVAGGVGGSSVRNLTINSGDGSDRLDAGGNLGGTLTTALALVINTGEGDDKIFLFNTNVVTDFILDTAGGQDDIRIRQGSTGRSLSVTCGRGGDSVILENFTAVDQMFVNLGRQFLSDNSDNSLLARFNFVGNNAVFLGGAAVDTMNVLGSNFQGTCYANGKEGNDIIKFEGLITNTFDYLFGGDGDDIINVNACTIQHGKFEVRGFAGSDQVTINGSIADTIFADMGDDADTLTLTNNIFRSSSGNELHGGKNTFRFDRLIRTGNSATLNNALVDGFELFS